MSVTSKTALIFINWNSGSLTVSAARSALETCVCPESLRLLVVDNGSVDDSLDVLRRDLPDAEVLSLPANVGFAKAVNAGLARVSEPYAFILNSDIEFRGDAIALLTGALRENPRAALACPKLLRPDGSLQAAAVPEPRLFWELFNRSLPRHLMGVGHDCVRAVPSVVGPCMAVDMQRIQKVGFLDERFFFFMEETDWCRRINRAGMQVLYVPAAEVMHLQGESANRRPVRARVQFYISRYRYFRKHAGVAAVALLYLGLWLRLSLSLVLLSLMILVSGGGKRYRDRFAVNARLWLWHLLGCRPRWGFES